MVKINGVRYDEKEIKEMIARGEYIEELANSECWVVRRLVANGGYFLDKFVNDEEPLVRREVARQGYGLDILVNDIDDDVKREVIAQGYGYEYFAKNETRHNVLLELLNRRLCFNILFTRDNEFISFELVDRGYRVDDFATSRFSRVRKLVARKTDNKNTLEKLLEDNDQEVRKMAEMMLNRKFKRED